MNKNLFHKEYLCMIEGTLKQKYGIIDLPIARKPGSIIERCVNITGQPSKTIYEIINVLPYPSSKYQFLNNIKTYIYEQNVRPYSMVSWTESRTS